MILFKELNEFESNRIIGGSNDLFWERVGIGIGAGAKCYINGGRVKDYDMIPPLCVGYGIGAAFKG
ncbi:hypothetical protein [Streptococcus uberis]|uniref:hypothetical protein n=1 Tax=Streptococcus uberis TaxID=1349 RepID=UPI001FF495F7|nr:hypothetical protein [Streptococcus uberis]MCK1221529.1 hypothetical protein [Streptococcus uberis]